QICGVPHVLTNRLGKRRLPAPHCMANEERTYEAPKALNTFKKAKKPKNGIFLVQSAVVFQYKYAGNMREGVCKCSNLGRTSFSENFRF
ncbi:MAG TPA: hypothetical protein DEP18_00980, partial [Flavobacteriales bacterium]|nr:hypothetical protein [Flavobacteriales bacterium]